MRYLGKKSLSTALAILVTILWWAEWALGFGCIVAALITANVRRAFAVKVPVNFEHMTIDQVRSPINDKVGIVNATNGVISVHVAATWQNMALMALGYGVVFAVIVVITYQLKQIFTSFRHDEPFQKLNLFRIRIIAFTLIAYSVFQWLFVIVTHIILLSMFTFKHTDLSYNLEWSFLIIGIIMLVLEGIFKTGVALEEEKQLTI